ncbi:universal stress protein [Brevibacillus sp. B_LB10_24]|uniref:universal stress protein n=1 Tax=Brevibacillus sp. B_LB10_24 TaxID=3380645 RepID=UPI0038BD55D8
MFQKVLLAVDGSQASEKAVEWAKKVYSEMPDTQFTFLHVIGPYIPAVASMGYVPIPFDPSVLETPEDTPSFQAWKQFSDRSRVHYNNLLGNAPEVICMEAETGEYDLIVIGAEGHGVVSSVLLGSVSGKVLHHAKCSVLVVR